MHGAFRPPQRGQRTSDQKGAPGTSPFADSPRQNPAGSPVKAQVLIVVQARLGSTRLPGKILKDLGGKPLLVRMLERLQRVGASVRVVVATTTERQDDPIVSLCEGLDVGIYRGHPLDLLDRHYRTALAAGARVVAKIPSDCPLIDPAVVDRVLERFALGDCDYVSNLHPATWPDGNDVEVIRFEALEAAWREAQLPMEREHTTPFIWERPERFPPGQRDLG